MLHRVESQKFDLNKVVFSNTTISYNNIETTTEIYTNIEVKNVFSISEVEKVYNKTEKIIFNNLFDKTLQQKLIKNDLRYKFDKDIGLVYEFYSFKINNTLEFTYFEKDLAEKEYKKILDLMTPKTLNSL